MANPTVSVCIPTYKGASHLPRAIQSVLAQSFIDFELVIVDDDSPDATPMVVADFDDARIRYVRNERNLGAEGNWNRCLDLARGRYFKLLPQDDALNPDCLERQVAVLESDRDEAISFVFCARSIVDAHDRAIMTRQFSSTHRGIVTPRTLIGSCVTRGTNLIGEPASVLFRKSLAVRTGRFDGSIPYVIDFDYWVRLLAHGPAYYVPESLVSFRISDGSWSVAIGKRQSEEFCRFIDKIARTAGPSVPWRARISGKIMARVNNALRLVVYRWLLR